MELQFVLEQFDAVEKTARHGATGFQRSRLHASTAGVTGQILGQGSKIPHASRCGRKTEKETNTDTYFLIISPNAGDKGFPGGASGEGPTCQFRRCRFHPWIRNILQSRKWQPTLVTFSGKSHGQRSLAGHSPWVTRSRT